MWDPRGSSRPGDAGHEPHGRIQCAPMERAVAGSRVMTVVALVGVLGCTGVIRGEAHGDASGVAGFSWVVEDQLAGMARPGAQQPLDDDLAALRQLGIRLLISLTETPTSADDAARHGIEVIHEPVPDMTAPTQHQLRTLVEAGRGSLAGGRAVGVHCAAGMGRTGTVLAAFLVADGRTAEDAMVEIRRLRPGSIETEEQEQAVRAFEVLWNAPLEPRSLPEDTP